MSMCFFRNVPYPVFFLINLKTSVRNVRSLSNFKIVVVVLELKTRILKSVAHLKYPVYFTEQTNA